MPAGAGETEGAHRHLGPEDGNAAPAGLGAALAHSLHTWSTPWAPRLCWVRRTACDVHKADPHLRVFTAWTTARPVGWPLGLSVPDFPLTSCLWDPKPETKPL